jgi:hypothetical protein
MANPTQAQIDKLTTNAGRWDNIINGSAESTVALDTFTVKTVAGYLQDLQATNPRGSWGSGTVYALKDVVVESSTVYICTIAHTGGTFATDLAAGKWAIYQLDVTSAITFGDDFTVDTNTLHVDSINNRVGIGTTSPTTQFEIVATNSRKFQFDTGKAFLVGSNSSWASKYAFKSTNGTDLGGFYAYGTDTALNYFNIGAAYNDGMISLITSTGSVGMGTVTPSSKAVLTLTSTTKGFLPPRMTETQRNAISTPPAGLIIYNTTDNKLNLYTTSWEEISSYT